jgi:hypothetical protein
MLSLNSGLSQFQRVTKDAASHKITSYRRIITLDEMRACLEASRLSLVLRCMKALNRRQ